MSALTVGEANLKAGNTHAFSWIMAVLLPLLCFGGSLVMAYLLYSSPDITIGSLWRLLPTIAWGVYMAVVAMIVMHVNMNIPDTPVAVQDAILDVGWSYIGIPLLFINTAVACFGHAWWLDGAVFCLSVAVIFGAIAFWVWLVRRYRE